MGKKLIEKIFKEIKFISAVELAELENLSSQRNYAAHPIIYLDNIENELVLKPLSKETSRDLIRKAFEIVFLKDAILGIELKDMFLEDLKQHYKKVKTNGLELFLNNKYFSKMTQEKKDSLFRVLWKFVFLLDNDECNINRESNYWGIQFLYNTDKKYFNNYIKNHEEKLLASLFVSTFYEDSNIKIYNKYNEMIKNFEKNNNIISLINFIINNPKIYKYLNEHAKNIINTSVKQMYIKEDIINTPFYETKSKNKNLFKAQLNLLASCMFLSDNPNTHIKNIFQMLDKLQETSHNWIEISSYLSINQTCLNNLFVQFDYHNNIKCFFNFLLDYTSSARRYDQTLESLNYFTSFEQNLKEMNYYKFLTNINNNQQFYESRDREDIIYKLEKSFKNRFNKDLAKTNEEKFLYHKIYNFSRTDTAKYDTKTVLKIINDRAHCYDSESLSDLINLLLNKINKNIEFLESEKIISYQNIINKLQDINDDTYNEQYVVAFKKYFLK